MFDPVENLKDFPCSFNLVGGDRVSQKRLMSARINVRADLDYGDHMPEETVRNLNLLTWVMFRLGEKVEAFRLNTEALKMTERQNITSLGNRIFMACHSGHRANANLVYFKELQALKSQENFDFLLTEAYAEQAYCYSRLGNVNNYMLCCELLESCTEKYPDNYLWKYGLGLAYKRLTGYNMRCSDSHRIDPAELTKKCTTILFEVAWDGDNYLKGLAYAQLASLRQYNFQREQDELFNYLNVQELSQRAVRYGRHNPAVLTQCGKSLKGEDIDLSIDLLQRSLEIRENSIAYHHLGLSLIRKNFPVKDDKHRHTKSALAPYGIASLRKFSKFSIRRCDKENDLVREAKLCFEKSLELSHGENKPARLSLAGISLKSGQAEEALVELNKIIDSSERSYFLTVVNAHELAGECLLELSELSEEKDTKENLKKDAVQQFTKAISLAADLASRNPEYKKYETDVWDSFKRLNEDVQQLPRPRKKVGQRIKLLELAKNENIAKVTKEMFDHGLELENFDVFLDRLTNLLTNVRYEEALAFLNVASAHSAMSKNVSWLSSQMTKARAGTYIGTAWARLMKDSGDSRRMFQQMFELKFGQCGGMVTDEEDEESETEKHDVLVVNDNTIDGPDNTALLARNLALVCRVTFGLDAFTSLEGQGNCRHEEILLNEIERHRLVLLILGENDSNEYNTMLTAAHKFRNENILVINCRRSKPYPSIIECYKSLTFTESPWQQTKLMEAEVGKQEDRTQAQQSVIFGTQHNNEMRNTKYNEISGTQQMYANAMSSKQEIEELFDGDKETLMRLYCFLVDEDFSVQQGNFIPDMLVK